MRFALGFNVNTAIGLIFDKTNNAKFSSQVENKVTKPYLLHAAKKKNTNRFYLHKNISCVKFTDIIS